MLPHLISHFSSFTLPIVRLHCITLPYVNLCFIIFIMLQYFSYPMISSVPLPCLALPHVPLHYTTFCSLDHCKHLLVNHFLFIVSSYATLHNISFTLFNIVFITLQCFTLHFTQCYALLPCIALHNIKLLTLSNPTYPTFYCYLPLCFELPTMMHFYFMLPCFMLY